MVTLLMGVATTAQTLIPIDTNTWQIQARGYLIEKYRGTDAIYLQAGSMTLKDTEFLDGIIEFDVQLKKEPAFPGVYFRSNTETGDAEQFYVRPHQSGNPDSNQAAPVTKNISPWQFYYGTRYSFPYNYRFDDWTHIKILVNGRRAQVFLDHSEKPHLSWNLFHTPQAGKITLRGGITSGLHIANIKISHEAPELLDFQPLQREAIPGLVPQWEVSDKFEESLLEPGSLQQVIDARSWQGKIEVEEGTAANISRIQNLRDGKPGNTVFTRIIIDSNRDQMKLFEFGYSDRVVAILNGKPIYWGNNRFRSRDYRYLGTIGLFDAIYLDLQRGENELLMAVSEDFGGWLITGRFKDDSGLSIK